MSWRVVFVTLGLATLALIAWIFQRVEAWPRRTAEEVSRTFAEVLHLQPRVTVNDRVFFERTASVLELATITRETQVEREMEHEWLGSKKRIKLRGVYRVKAGFDLTQPLAVRVEDRRIEVALPPAKVLGAEQLSFEVLALENGIWNRIRESDVADEVRVLPGLARRKALASGLEKEATDALAAQLREKFAPRYEVVFSSAPTERRD